MFRVLLIFTPILLMGCNYIEDKIDRELYCEAIDKPQFGKSSLSPAILNEEYSARISADKKNTANDDWYYYTFKLEGDLPNGMEFITEIGERRTRLQGTPTELGTFKLKLSVITTISQPYATYEDAEASFEDEERLCENKYSKTYTLEVIAE